MIGEARKLFSLLPKRLRRRLAVIIGLSCAAAAAELITIGAMVPFLALVTNDDGAALLDSTLAGLGLAQYSSLALVSVALVLLALGSAVLRLLLVWRSQAFAAVFGSFVVDRIYSGHMRQNLEQSLDRNSSEVLSGIEKVQELTYGFVMPLIQALTSAVIAFCIVAVLIVINPSIAMAAAGFVAIAYWLMSAVILPRVRRNSGDIAEALTKRTRTLQETLSGKREIMLGQSHDLFEDMLRKQDQRYRRATSHNVAYAQSPRLIFEASAIVALVLVAIMVSTLGDGLLAALPSLGALALGVQRLLPLVQAMWSGLSRASGNRALVEDILLLPVEGERSSPVPVSSLPIKKALEFVRVAYAYPGGELVLSDVSFSLGKGEWLGVSGPSGSGKSTLIDLLLGLRVPISGAIYVDQRQLLDGHQVRAWQSSLAHVSDKVPLVDGSILENVCFGQHEDLWSPKLAHRALDIAQLSPLVDGLPEGLASPIGEQGAKISSGERQRLGIARALYRCPELLVLDEATSMIDADVETSLLETIRKSCPDLTV
ncbi:MAG: ABC transporter ATP-binding protein [Pseudomonadota bacterium]